MKHPGIFALLFLSVFLASCFQVKAQEKHNQIKTSLAMPLGKILEFSYERIINKDFSVQIGAGFGGGNEDVYYVNPQFRYYLSEKWEAPTGVFVSPYGLFGKDTAGGGLTVGVQKLFKQKVSLEAYLGPLIAERISVWGGINVGFAF